MEDNLPIQEDLNETRRITKAERKAKRREEKKLERERQVRLRKRRRVVMWVSVIGVILVVVVGIVFVVSRDGGENFSLGKEVVEADWVRGNRGASVTLVEYSDFECSACAQFNQTVKEVVEELGDRIQLVYRHFPIDQLHKHAQLAAEATEAAGRQGKFWEMHDVLFERQREWAGSEDARDRFGRYAEELELDMTRFDEDIEDDELRDRVQEHRSSGVRSGISGTPTFFLNGERMKGYNTQDDFKKLIIEKVENS
jgi:protein-disulfide isomerase